MGPAQAFAMAGQQTQYLACLCPASSTPIHMTTVKNSVYFPIKAELSFKNQLISLMRGCEAELQRQGLPPSLLQAKSCGSLRVMHAKQVLHHPQGCSASAGPQ